MSIGAALKLRGVVNNDSPAFKILHHKSSYAYHLQSAFCQTPVDSYQISVILNDVANDLQSIYTRGDASLTDVDSDGMTAFHVSPARQYRL